MRLHIRSIRLAMVLAIGITLLAAPAVSADHSFLFPAGEACSFGVLAEAVHLPQPTVARNPVGWGDASLTNLESGATFDLRVRYVSSETFDPDTNTWLVEEMGRKMLNFFPGEPGPNGTVGEHGALFAFSGSFQYTVDADGFFTAFSYQGTYLDLCAELAS